jgi:hypothetical protein
MRQNASVICVLPQQSREERDNAFLPSVSLLRPYERQSVAARAIHENIS